MKTLLHSAAIAATLLGAVLHASTTTELSRAAAVAGRGIYRTGTTSAETSFYDQWNRMVRISSYDRRMFYDPNAEAIWSQAQRHARRALAALVRIAEIDDKKPSNWAVVASALKAAAEDTKDKERKEWGTDVWVRLLMEVNKISLQEDFRSAERAVNAQLAALQNTVSGSDATSGIGITHLPSWQGAYDSDLLVLTNHSGRDLVLPSIYVTFQDTQGARITHLHRASGWPANQKLYFRYPYYGSDYGSGETVSHPAAVRVSVFSGSGDFQDVYTWTATAWDGVIRQYLDDLKLSGHFLGEYVENGSNTLYYPGYKFQVSGLNRLPIKRITIRFTRRGESQEVYWAWNQYLLSGKDVVLRSKYFEDFGKHDPPERKEIVFEFTDTSAPARFVQ